MLSSHSVKRISSGKGGIDKVYSSLVAQNEVPIKAKLHFFNAVSSV